MPPRGNLNQAAASRQVTDCQTESAPAPQIYILKSKKLCPLMFTSNPWINPITSQYQEDSHLSSKMSL